MKLSKRVVNNLQPVGHMVRDGVLSNPQRPREKHQNMMTFETISFEN